MATRLAARWACDCIYFWCEYPKIAPFCSVKFPERLILETYDLAKRFRRDGIPVVGGFRCFPCDKQKARQPPLFREMLAAEKSLYPFDHPEDGGIVDAVARYFEEL